jgi:hypothetical protein
MLASKVKAPEDQMLHVAAQNCFASIVVELAMQYNTPF